MKHSKKLISTQVIGSLLLTGVASGETTFLGGNLRSASSWTNGLPAGQHATITNNGSYTGQNQDSRWISGSTVSIGGDATLTLGNDLSVFEAEVAMYSGAINCSDDFFAQRGSITIYDGVVTANDQYTANANQGRITIFGGTHSSGSASNDYFGASGSSSDRGCRVDMLGGEITAGGYRFMEFTINNLGGDAVLRSASAATDLEMSGSMEIATDWIGSWTVRAFSGDDWEDELTGGGWTLGGEAINSVVFAENFEVSSNGQTLSLAITHFLGGQLASSNNWSNGLAPMNQNLVIAQDGINTSMNQDNLWLSGSTVSMGGDATLTLKDIAVNNAEFKMYSGTITCSDDFFAFGGTITIYGGTTTAQDEYAANSRGGQIIIYGGTHSSGVGSSEFFGASGSASSQGQGMDILGGTVTGGFYRFQNFTTNSIGGEAVLLSASSETGLEMSGLMNVVGGWIGSWTVESFSGNDWRNELTGGGWLLNGLPIDNATFASGFRVSADGKTLSATGDFDELDLLEAINGIENHITGAATLSDAEIMSAKAAFDREIERLAFDEDMIEACLELVEAYDSEVGALWVAGSPVRNFSRADATDSDIHWVVFEVMQGIMDYTYTSENISRYRSLLNEYKFESSAHFPGAVTPPSNPNASYTVQIDGSYLDTFGKEIFHDDRPARKPTGAHLAPGSIATVTVPSSLVNRGYQIRVGAFSWDLSFHADVRRLDRTSLVYDIDSTSIEVANPLGGGIYIEVPFLADAGVVSVSIQNAVRAPYYSAKGFHQTTLSEWQNTERNHPGPIANFQTEKFMMQVPTKTITAVENPLTSLAQWDETVDTMNRLLGYPAVRGKESLYVQVDVNSRADAFAPGYPTSNFRYNPDTPSDGNSQSFLFRGPETADWIFYHEQGHHYLFPKFPREEESAVNLLGMAVRTQNFGWSLNEAFVRSAANSNATVNHTVEGGSIFHMLSEDFVNARSDTDGVALTGHTKYADIVRLFGWGVLERHWEAINLEHENGNPLGIYLELDEIIFRLSEASGHDMRPLLHFWSIHPQNQNTLAARISAAGALPSRTIYDELVARKAMVPANNAAFREFSTHWWNGVPSANSSYGGRRYHASLWDSYDESVAAVTRDNVQDIIDLYFPNGRPATDPPIDGGGTGGGLVAEWSMDEGSGTNVSDSSGNNLNATAFNTSWVNGISGSALDFNGSNSRVNLPTSAFDDIDQEISVSMWVFGSPAQPRNDSTFYAENSSGQRVLNVHLPWSNSQVYWDAGFSGGTYDRINKVANASQFRGQWNHWVFVKNASAGRMEIYHNGSLFHSGTGKVRSMSGVATARLGRQIDATSYDGVIDEVSLYNVALSASEVSDLYDSLNASTGTVINGVPISWLQSFGLPGTDAGALADSDGDGRLNWQEYAAGGNPLVNDNQAGIRVTEYYLTTGDFNGTSATVTLNQNLAADYFVLVRGSHDGNALSMPDNDYARVTAVPSAAGDMANSGGSNRITLTRSVADQNWEGVVTVVECLNPSSTGGFKMLDILSTNLNGTSGTDTSENWSDIDQVTLFGGYRGGGANFVGTPTSRNQGTSVYTRVFPTGSNTLNWRRNAGGETLLNAMMTTFVIEWGAEWNVQHVNVAGAAGGGGANATSEYITSSINSVNRRNSWVWGTGTRLDAGIGDSAEGSLVTLGNGVTQNTTENRVAVGSEYTDASDFDIYIMTHVDLAVDYRFKADGDSGITDLAVTVDTAASGTRFAWSYNGCNGTGTFFPRPRMWARYTGNGQVTISRGFSGQNFPAWIQGIDFSGLNN